MFGNKKSTPQIKTVNLIVQDRNGRKAYEKLVQQGWVEISSTPRRGLRGATYIFRKDPVS